MNTRATESLPAAARGVRIKQRSWRLERVLSTSRSARIPPALVFLLVCLGVLCLFYYEVIFLNRTFLPFGSPAEVMGAAPPWQFSGTVRADPYRIDSGGSAWQLEPWAKTVASTYATGELPLWNTHQFFGTPLAADGQPGAFDILRLPTLLTTHAWGWDVYYLSQSALCLTLTYVFGRSVGFGRVAAFVAGVAYSFSGFMFIRGNMHYIEVYHLLPGVLWGTELVAHGAALRRGVLIVVAGVALTLFAGMPEVSLLTFLYAASYGAFRVAWEARVQRSWCFAAHRLVVLALAWIAGISIAAPVLLPLLEYLPLSYNIHPPERELGLISLPLRVLAYVGVPYIEGLPARPIVAGSSIPLDDYSGAAVVLLAMVGSLSLRRLGSLSSVAVFGLASVAIWGAKLFGVAGINELGRLPLLVQDLIYIWGTPLLSFSLALLAAAGVQVIAIRSVSSRTALIAGCCFVGYLLLAAALTWPTLQVAGRRHAASTLGLAAAAGVGIWLCMTIGRRLPRSLAPVGACLVTLAELVILAPRDVYSDRYDSLAQPPYVTWLQQQRATDQPFRVFSNDGILYPDYASAFGLDDARDDDGLYPRRTWEFVKTFLSPSVSDRFVGGFGHPELPTNLFANKWINLSNVRFIVRPSDQAPADATLAEVIVASRYPPTDELHTSLFTIDGQRREVLVERTPGEVEFGVHPDASQPRLTFFVGLDPASPAPSAAQFSAYIQSGDQRELVFQRTLDPAQEGDRRWVPGSIDLTPYVGREVGLVLQTTSAGGASSFPGWGDLRLSPEPDPGQFQQVYRGEVSIWDNAQAAPRAFLVDDVEAATTSQDVVARMRIPAFDPLHTAVVEGSSALAAELPTGPATGDSAGSATITEYRQLSVRIAVDARQAGLLVLTDSYFPGWTATLDGQPTPILATDLAFRGVVVPPGSHQVTFSFVPMSFWLGVGLAAAASMLLGLAVWRPPLTRSRLGVRSNTMQGRPNSGRTPFNAGQGART